jgi:hypothetical protein
MYCIFIVIDNHFFLVLLCCINNMYEYMNRMSDDPSKISFTFNRGDVSSTASSPEARPKLASSQASSFMQDLSREDKIVQGKDRLARRLEAESLKEIVRN